MNYDALLVVSLSWSMGAMSAMGGEPDCASPHHAWSLADFRLSFLTTDADGNVLAAGALHPPENEPRTSHAAVEKLSALGVSEWVYLVGNGEAEAGANGLVTAPTGAIYVAGGFSGVVDFDPGPGVSEHASAAGHSCPACEANAFLTKLGEDGSYCWTRSLQWSGATFVIAVDVALSHDGDLLLFGPWGGGVDFDPGPGVVSPPDPAADMFLAAFSPDGAFRWVKTFGARTANTPRTMSVDDQGHIFLSGLFRRTVDFDPGLGVVQRTAVRIRDNVFVNKLSSEGQFLSVVTYPVWNAALAVPPEGGFVLAGWFDGTLDFDPTGATHLAAAVLGESTAGGPTSDIFVTRINPDGTHAWTYVAGTSGEENAQAVTIDPSGDILVSGTFARTDEEGIDFDGGPNIAMYTCDAPHCDYLLRLSPDGEFKSLPVISGVGINRYGRDLVTDLDGNIIFTRDPGDPIDVDPSCEEAFYSLTEVITKLTCEPRTPDSDGDGDVDLSDLAAFQNCFAGEGATTCNPGCDIFDLIPDNAINQADFAEISPLLTGP